MKEKLTPREYEITELTAFGMSQDEIADYLQISRFTVDELIRRAKRKLNIQKATELAAWYYITRHNVNISAGISEKLRRCISAALLSLVMFSMIVENFNMLRVQASRTITARNVRTSRSIRTRKNEYKFQLA